MKSDCEIEQQKYVVCVLLFVYTTNYFLEERMDERKTNMLDNLNWGKNKLVSYS